MTCKDCIMFTHCRYDLERNGEPCEHFKDKDRYVDIIRCGDCKFYHKEKGGWCELHVFDFDSYGFCFDGEREESEVQGE